jgi:hypothetical protein
VPLGSTTYGISTDRGYHLEYTISLSHRTTYPRSRRTAPEAQRTPPRSLILPIVSLHPSIKDLSKWTYPTFSTLPDMNPTFTCSAAVLLDTIPPSPSYRFVEVLSYLLDNASETRLYVPFTVRDLTMNSAGFSSHVFEDGHCTFHLLLFLTQRFLTRNMSQEFH